MTYDEETQTYYDENGNPLTPEQVEEILNESIEGDEASMTQLAALVAIGVLTVEQWQEAMQESITNAYIRQYALGKGGVDQLTEDDYLIIATMVDGQFGYLSEFGAEIGRGQLSEAAIAARARMYTNSSRQAFYAGLTAGALVAAAIWARQNGRPVPDFTLPAYPGDGRTRCLSNCKCVWRQVSVRREGGDELIGYDFYWELGIAEHCPDCLANASRWNPYRVRF